MYKSLSNFLTIYILEVSRTLKHFGRPWNVPSLVNVKPLTSFTKITASSNQKISYTNTSQICSQTNTSQIRQKISYSGTEISVKTHLLGHFKSNSTIKINKEHFISKDLFTFRGFKETEIIKTIPANFNDCVKSGNFPDILKYGTPVF